MIFAIDYGTSNSLLAVADGKKISEPLALDPESPDPTVFRSILYFPNQNQCFYGQRAIKEYCENQAEGRLIRSIKKYLPSQRFLGSWIEDRVVKLEDLISYFLLEMRKRACEQMNRDVDSVLLGRPAKFSDDPAEDKLAQYRLEKAAHLAGFKHIGFFPEPLAAAFDLKRKLDRPQKVLVVDLGGGTSDFTVLEIGPRPFKESDVLALSGVSVAGDAMDGKIMQNGIAAEFGAQVRYRVPLGNNILEMPKTLLDHICSPADIAQLRRSDYYEFFKNVQRWAPAPQDKRKLDRLFTLVDDQLGFQLFEEIERNKRELSTSPHSQFTFPYPEIDLDLTLRQKDFESWLQSPSDKILKCMDDTIRMAQLQPQDLDIVYCTGGTAKLSLIQKGLAQRFPSDKIMKADYFHSVIFGLTQRAAEL